MRATQDSGKRGKIAKNVHNEEVGVLHRILENCEKLAKTYNGEEVGVRATQGDECENCENSVNSITVRRWGLRD